MLPQDLDFRLSNVEDKDSSYIPWVVEFANRPPTVAYTTKATYPGYAAVVGPLAFVDCKIGVAAVNTIQSGPSNFVQVTNPPIRPKFETRLDFSYFGYWRIELEAYWQYHQLLTPFVGRKFWLELSPTVNYGTVWYIETPTGVPTQLTYSAINTTGAWYLNFRGFYVRA